MTVYSGTDAVTIDNRHLKEEAPPPDSNVFASIADLESVSEQLGQAIGRLARRLEPVLINPEIKPGEDTARVREQSPLAEILRCLVDQSEIHLGTVLDLLNRLDLPQ